MKNSGKVHKDEHDIIIEGLRKNGRRAYEKALENGVSVTVLRGKNVCRVEPDGKVSIVGKVEQSRVKVSQQKFKLR
jgi:hypothetical protein